LVGNHLLLFRDFGNCALIFMNVFVVITVAMVGNHVPLRDFGFHGIIFMNVCVVIAVVMVW
jgi:uncharacterized YccA/Bax inhibitor family protein